jgi:hypothetical protein
MQRSLARRLAPTHPTRLRDKEAHLDGSQFDAWTRRGFGAAAGGLAGSLLAMSAIPGAEAKKKKKKCIKEVGKHCQPDGPKHKKCCCGYECHDDLPINNGGFVCCRAPGFPASSSEDCCSGRLELGHCVCKTLGQPCGLDRECCSGDCGSSNECVGPL